MDDKEIRDGVFEVQLMWRPTIQDAALFAGRQTITGELLFSAFTGPVDILSTEVSKLFIEVMKMLRENDYA